MVNQLFIICPFSCMESFLQDRYGNNSFFLTCSGAVLQHHESEFVAAVRQLIINEKINAIVIVNDTACRFINGILKGNKIFGLSSEKAIREIYTEHYFSNFRDRSLTYQQQRLAELNIRRQASDLLTSQVLGECITEYGIAIKGLITNKHEKLLKEIQIDSSVRKVVSKALVRE